MNFSGLELVFPTVMVAKTEPTVVLYQGPLLQDWPTLVAAIAALPIKEDWLATIYRPNYDSRRHPVTIAEIYRTSIEWYFTNLLEQGPRNYHQGPKQLLFYFEELAKQELERGRQAARRSTQGVSD